MFGQTPETLPWAGLRYQHTQAVRAKLAETRAPAGVNKILAAVRGVLREAWRLGLMDAEAYERAADIKSVRGEQLPRGRALGKRELQKLFVACAKDETAAGRRDAALIAVLYGGGLRRSEVVALDLADYRPETAELRIRHGKGQKGRVVLRHERREAGARRVAGRARLGAGAAVLAGRWPRPTAGQPAHDRPGGADAAAASSGAGPSARRSRRTTSGARSLAISLRPVPTWSPSRSSPGTRTCRRPRGTTGEARRRSGARRSCCTCRSWLTVTCAALPDPLAP